VFPRVGVASRTSNSRAFSEDSAGQHPNVATQAAPSRPSDLKKRALWDVLKRTVREFREDNLTDWAAALTYYGVLSIFPALLVFVSIVGLIGAPVTEPLLDNIAAFAPSEARDILTNAVRELERSRSSAGLLTIVALAGGLWAASGYVAAFIRASNIVWDVEEGRPVWKTLPLRVGLTLVLLILLAASALLVVFTGPLAEKAGDVIGVSGAVVTAWDIGKWLLLVLLISIMLAILYYAAPNVRQPGFRWITPGSILAVILWIVASAGFALYVAAFGSYNKTYGSLGAVIVFLIWLWLTNVAVLLGAELNAELERRRQVEGGHPAEREPFLPPRDKPS
jgi:membrane protein